MKKVDLLGDSRVPTTLLENLDTEKTLEYLGKSWNLTTVENSWGIKSNPGKVMAMAVQHLILKN